MCKRIAIIGLGLIGGSMAMALKGFEDYEIVGVDRDPATLEFARTHGVADYLSTDAGQAVSTADVVYLCLHPRGIVDFLSTYRACFRPGALVTDVCGIKTAIVDAATVLPDEVAFCVRTRSLLPAIPWRARRPPASFTPTALSSAARTTSSPPAPRAARNT